MRPIAVSVLAAALLVTGCEGTEQPTRGSAPTVALNQAVDVGDQALAVSRRCGELWRRGYLLNFLSLAN